MTNQYIVDQALNELYNEPSQDMNSIFECTRISPINGKLNTIKSVWSYIELPEEGVWYHVFTLGRIYPTFAGIEFEQLGNHEDTWTPFVDVINKNKLRLDLYTLEGYTVPHHACFYRFTKSSELIIAVRDMKHTGLRLNKTDVYMRIYDGAYYETVEAIGQNKTIFSFGLSIKTAQDTSSFFGHLNQYAGREGTLFIFKNGLMYKKETMPNFSVGDEASFIYEDAVYKKVKLFERDLYSFNSTLDQLRKYLVHYPSFDVHTTHFIDEVDIYVGFKDLNQRDVGLFLARNDRRTFRMVTHRDYSLSVHVVDTYTDYIRTIFPNLTNTDHDFYIELYIRHAGMDRHLVFNNEKLHELYKLNDERVHAALKGVHSNLDFWVAENLEKSPYTTLMQNVRKDVTLDLSVDAYGYDALSSKLGQTPSDVYLYQGETRADLPRGLMDNATAFEYDQLGQLVSIKKFQGYDYYKPNNSATTHVELLYGQATNVSDDVYGDFEVLLRPGLEYRVYHGYRFNNELVLESWRDVTEDLNVIKYEDGVVSCIDRSTPNQVLMVRYLESFYIYEVGVTYDRGNIQIPLINAINLNGRTYDEKLVIPYGEVDVFVNKLSLIENIDYVIRDNTVTLASVKHLKGQLNDIENVVIRMRGFCNPDLSRTQAKDVGFVINNVLSDDKAFDLRDDRVLRIVVGGQYLRRTDFKFGETDGSVTTVNRLNGLPYEIKDVVVPMKRWTGRDTYPERILSLDRNRRLAEYMTEYYEEPPHAQVNPIAERYPLFSPFISAIIDALTHGGIDNSRIKESAIGRERVFELCAPYEHWLLLDPLKKDQYTQSSYIDIRPHPFNYVVMVNFFQMRFITKVVEYYTDNRVPISPFIRIA